MLNRALAVAHMHLVDRVTLFVMPFAICGSAFVINIVLWTFVPVDGRNTGAASSLHFFVLAAAILAVLRGLPFALGMGASRRAFVLGTEPHRPRAGRGDGLGVGRAAPGRGAQQRLGAARPLLRLPVDARVVVVRGLDHDDALDRRLLRPRSARGQRLGPLRDR